jgi:hypothetical protein
MNLNLNPGTMAKALVLCLALPFTSLSVKSQTPLNGNYAIGTGKNFSTINDAVKALTTNGINGPVVFDISDGNYTEQIRIPSITGASATNTVTFQSASAVNSAVTISYFVKTEVSPLDSNFVMLIANANYLKFQNLTFRNTNPDYGAVIKITGQTSYLTFLKNAFIGATCTSCDSYSSDILYDGGKDYQSIFRNNVFQGGTVGLYYNITGGSVSYYPAIVIDRNRFKDQTGNFMTLYHIGNDSIINNTFTSESTSLYQGFGFYYGFNSTISGNIINITNSSAYNLDGFYFFNVISLNMFNNNVSIGCNNNTVRGLCFFYTSSANIYFNSIHEYNSNAACMDVYLDENSSGINIEDNIFSSNGKGTLITKKYISPWSSSISLSDYNDFYTSAGSIAIWYTSSGAYGTYTTLTTLADWKTKSSMDAHSLSILPGFKSDIDLHIFNLDLNGKGTPISTVTRDIDGETRNTIIPDIGSDEFEPAGADIGITGMRDLQTGLCPIKVLMSDFGTENISQATINWLFDGNVQASYNWTGSMKQKDTVEVILGNINVSSQKSHNFKIWTSQPNGKNDSKHDNDTLVVTKMVPLSGKYTIGGTQPDYASFSDAITDMITRGIYDSVVFNVRKGTYNEKLTIPLINGASHVNSIVFQSETGNYNDVSIAPVNATGYYPVFLNNAIGVTFRYMTISAANLTVLYAVEIKKGGNHSFTNNFIVGQHVPGGGVPLVKTDDAGNLTFANNFFYNGSEGISVYFSEIVPEAVYQITGNQFSDQSNRAIEIGSIAKVIIRNNIIQTDFEGIFISTCNDVSIEKNYISTLRCQNAIRISEITTATSVAKQIANNFIYVGDGSSTGIGINIGTANNLNIYNNNLSINANGANSCGLGLQKGKNVKILNNILASFSSACLINVATLDIITQCDYNDLYSSGGTFVNTNNGPFNDLDSWKALTGFDAHSLSTDPGYFTQTNLHISNGILDRSGLTLPEIKDDIDSDSRDALHPDIGADEISLASTGVDMKLEGLASPTIPIKLGPQKVSVMIRNYGTLPLTSVMLHWKFNQFMQDSVQWTGNLQQGDSIIITLGTQNFARLTNNTILIWTTHPNHISDDSKLNKTLTVNNLITALSGEYSIGPNKSDFTSFAAAIDMLHFAGISDKVIFNVGKGTYNERLILYSIRGAASDRTITFCGDSTVAGSSILTMVGTSFDNYVIKLHGTDFISFRNLKITNTSSLYGRIVALESEANCNTFEKNIFHAESTSAYPLVYSVSSLNNHIRFNNNVFENGSLAIDLRGDGRNQAGTIIGNNKFLNQISGGINLRSQDSLSISGNEFSNANLSLLYNGIYCAQGGKNLRIVNNKFNLNGGNAIGLDSCNSSDADRILIANNFIAVKVNGSQDNQGLSMSFCTYGDIVYNNFNLVGAANPKIAVSIDHAQHINLFNNIYANSTGGTIFNITGSSQIQSDHNNFYCTGSKFAVIENSTVTTLNDWQKKTGWDATSYSYDPYYLSETDLHVAQPAINNKGMVLSRVSTDIDNELRSSLTPDIGADEFVSATTDIGVSGIINKSGCRFGKADSIKISISNYGSDAQSAFSIGYIINADTVIENAGSIILSPGQQLLYAFRKTADLSKIGPHVIKAFVHLKNDSKSANDTATVDIYNSSVFDPNIKTSDTIICAGKKVTMTASGGSLYVWSDGSTLSSFTITPSVTKTYSVIATNMYGCSVTDSVRIQVNANPSLPYFTKNLSYNLFCNKDSVILTCKNYTDHLTWSTGATTTSIVVKKTDTYYVTYTDANNCSAQSFSVDLYQEAAPYIYTNANTLVCAGSEITLTANNLSSCLWSTGSKKSTITVLPSKTSTYYITGNTQNGCLYKDSVTLNVSTSTLVPDEVTSMFPADSSKNLDLPVKLSWESTNGAAFYKVTVWSAKDSAKTLIKNVDGISFYLTNTDLEYGKSYRWKVESSSGCIYNPGKTQLFTIRKLPDLIVNNIQTPISVYSGQTTEVTMEVKNIGAGNTLDKIWEDATFLSIDSSFMPISTVYQNSIAYLDSGQSYQATYKFAVRENILGDFYVFGSTDVSTQTEYGTVLEQNEKNNTTRGKKPIWVKLKPPPDLQITSITYPTTMVSEQTYKVSWTVKNKGEGTAVSNKDMGWWDGLSLSKDGKGPGMPIINYHFPDSLKPGEEYTITKEITIPVGKFGTYYIVGITDIYNEVAENAYDANNLTQGDSIHVILYPPADLTAANLIYPDTVNNVDPFRIEWTDINEGAAASKVAAPALIDEILLVPIQDRTFDNAIKFNYHWYKEGIEEGFQEQAYLDILLDRLITPGAYFLYVHVNSTSSTYEFNTKNNLIKGSKIIQITRVEWPDLKVKEIDFPDTISIDQPFPFSYRVINQGNVSTRVNQWFDGIGFSTNKLTSGTSEISENTIEHISIDRFLEKDSAYTKHGNLDFTNILKFTPGGNYYLSVNADEKNVVYECTQDTNNLSSKRVYLKTGDLTNIVNLPDSVYAGSTLDIKWKVKNKGDATMSIRSWFDVVKFKGISIYSQNNKQQLKADSSYNCQFQFKIPPNTSGWYKLEFICDYLNTSNEKDHNNNYTADSIYVKSIQPSDLYVSNATFPDQIIAGQPFTIKWTVTNQGNSETSIDSWTDNIVLSNDYILSKDDYEVALSSHYGKLAPGQSYSKEVNIFIPVNMAGIYNLLLKTDYSETYDKGYVWEGNNEDNNTRVYEINVLPQHLSDLIVTKISNPAKIIAGDNMKINWTIQNIGPFSATGNMKDMIYLSKDTVWDNNDPLIAEIYRYIDLKPSESNADSVTFQLNSAGIGDYYIIVKTDNQNNIYETRDWNNAGVATKKLSVDVNELKLNTTLKTRLFRNRSLYYYIAVPDSLKDETLIVSLLGDTINGNNEIYARNGDIPTLSNFDYSFQFPSSGKQELVIPAAKIGNCFLMFSGYSTVDTAQQITIVAKKLNFQLRRIKANQGGNNGKITMQIDGANFDSTMFVALVNGSDSIKAEINYFADASKVFVTFNLNNKKIGKYDVFARNNKGKTTLLKNGFEVIEGTEPKILVSLSYFFTSRSLGVVQVQYVNAGNVDVYDISAVVKSIDSGSSHPPISFTPDDINKGLLELSFNDFAEPHGPQGLLRPGAFGTKVVYVLIPSSTVIVVVGVDEPKFKY